MILVDSSVWFHHLKEGSKELQHVLENEEVLTHPFILGELTLGNYKNRREILDLLFALPLVAVASNEEALFLVERGRLHGKGIGWIDVNLIASSLLSRCHLWTYDRALMRESKRMKVPTLSSLGSRV